MIAEIVKKRGRPKTGIGKPVGLRLYPHQEDVLRRWIKSRPKPKPSKMEAIREGIGRLEADIPAE